MNEMTREKKKRESNDGFGLTFKWITKGQSVSRVMQNERKCVEMNRSVDSQSSVDLLSYKTYQKLYTSCSIE